MIFIFYRIHILTLMYFQLLQGEGLRVGGCYIVYGYFQQYFSYIVAVSFIDGGDQSTWRKPLTCRTSLINFIT